ncbi:MAG: hypothetical protein Q8Q48_01495 [Candidatus Staskawiczbacteria bacterium]|nr:hypothetical protein [Candidatus Staskawiczbacteria bacterium]
MPEQTVQAKVTKVFSPLAWDHEISVMPLLAVFIRHRHDIGLTEEQLVKESGLGNDALRVIRELEQDGFVDSFICQEGTCGPYARRYRLIKGLEIELKLSRPA